LNREINGARNNAQFYTERMIDYLCNNTSLFPEYNQANGDEMVAEKKAYFQSGMEISQGRDYNREYFKKSWVLDR